MSGWQEIMKDHFLVVAAVSLSRKNGHTCTQTMTMHWRRIETPCDTDAENMMRGIAFQQAQEEKPGFSVDQILVGIIPENDDPERMRQKEGCHNEM